MQAQYQSKKTDKNASVVETKQATVKSKKKAYSFEINYYTTYRALQIIFVSVLFIFIFFYSQLNSVSKEVNDLRVQTEIANAQFKAINKKLEEKLQERREKLLNDVKVEPSNPIPIAQDLSKNRLKPTFNLNSPNRSSNLFLSEDTVIALLEDNKENKSEILIQDKSKTKKLICEVQASLKDKGYSEILKNEVKGKIGNGTRVALKDFRKKNGLPTMDGIDIRTLYALGIEYKKYIDSDFIENMQ